MGIAGCDVPCGGARASLDGREWWLTVLTRPPANFARRWSGPPSGAEFVETGVQRHADGAAPDQVRSGERRQMDESHLPAEAGGASASIATKRRKPSGLGASAPQGSGQGAHRKMDGARQGGGGQRRSLCESTRMGAVLVVGPGRPTCAAFQRVRHSASSSVLKLAHFTTAVRLSVAKSAQGTIRASSGRRVWRGTQG
jgi:hypothetical protein